MTPGDQHRNEQSREDDRFLGQPLEVVEAYLQARGYRWTTTESCPTTRRGTAAGKRVIRVEQSSGDILKLTWAREFI
ncbi:MAG: hypothetical protein GX030_02155 [Firmicutes bacterium]|nr:hypothetical protein [Bacillota bacterium]